MMDPRRTLAVIEALAKLRAMGVPEDVLRPLSAWLALQRFSVEAPRELESSVDDRSVPE